MEIIQALKQILGDPLPGWEAQKLMMPETRRQFKPFNDNDLHPASVLISLFPKADDWYFPLIRRTEDGYAHSGQIALPGGRREGSETKVETALREAQEEVNLPAAQVSILGRTSPLPIPVSKHIVQPFVGYLDRQPSFQRAPKEVDEILLISLQDFTALDISTEIRQFSGVDFEIPYFEIMGHKVWGATGMILSEFKAILSRIT
ncbi:MAG: CoA pyrophosphatase [Candidatus Marinimicrobia bacterium]|nr:CoA pyrophosphatase [Candidatus Neomarinimicrobiota bacterium]MCF7851597.1 CoA pyrophosphatase [Candidatus Neomarinimicrobiota bacterium]MCF7905357.1 CoA pyrophosphatase [Candidatus Neomarinimicrobiota bacterium]